MSAVGQRYAKALYEMCPADRADRVLSDLDAFGGWLRDLPELRGALENPAVPAAVKRDTVARVAAKAGFEDLSARFVALVVAQRRLRQWADIVDAFRALTDDARGISRARVVTARPLTPDQRAAFAARLEAALGRAVALETQEDPALLGGVLLKVGSTVYDGTASGALRSLRAALEKR
jgi:F-type H+-transporting ATPase subunit delta